MDGDVDTFSSVVKQEGQQWITYLLPVSLLYNLHVSVEHGIVREASHNTVLCTAPLQDMM